MTVAMKSGELFAGVAGLGRAVAQEFHTEHGWFCEFDAAPSKVLAHHYPDVPNFGDVTKVDFRMVPHTHVRAGGFPCQDVSLAGRRKGMKDGTRSGLWSEFRRSIQEDRPDWVVIENVRGLLSANAVGDVEPCPWCLGDDADQHALRALGAVLGDLADLGFDAEWTGIRAADIGAPHGRFRIFILAWPREHTAPDHDGARLRGIGRSGGFVERDVDGRDREGQAPRNLSLLPTPQAADGTGGRIDKGELGGTRDSGAKRAMTLASVVHHRLLPTPRTTDMNGAGAHGDGGADLRTVASLMPTPRASRGGSATETMYALGAERHDDERPQGQVVVDITDWGPYANAITRWERAIGRPAPAPVRFDGKGGKPRLNPELTEWMMGWPAGWVTAAVIGLSRAEQLKACGNGVVTLQAVAALREMLARPGVPDVEYGLAA